MYTTNPLPEALQGGSEDNLSVAVKGLTLKDGTELELPTPGVTVVVGANNVGKSTLLSEILTAIQHGSSWPHGAPKVLKSLQLGLEGSGFDLLDWFAHHVPYRRHPGGVEGFTGLMQGQYLAPLPLFDRWGDLQRLRYDLGELTSFFVKHMGVMERLGSVGDVPRRANFYDPPMHPLHSLEDNSALAAELSGLSYRVFRKSLTLDALGTSSRLVVGEPDCIVPPVNEIGFAYREAMDRLPRLSGQGDGMKSLIGLCLPIIAASYPIVIIDEPEAFLHPPQAAALGRELGELARSKRLQLILATHDRNILTGLLASAADVSVVRLERREEEVTKAYQLDASRLRSVWSDPVLRYSNVLDGLFHRLVVLTEGDRDCRFYSAALDHLGSHEELEIPPTDVLFVPSSGKAGLYKFARALHEVRVPVVAIPDLDIIDEDKGVLKNLIETFHGIWEDFKCDWIDATKPFRADRSFAYLKSAGMRAFPRGSAAAAGQSLVARLEQIGIVVVEVGELEQFARNLEVRKGEGWLVEALEVRAHEGLDAQNHMRRVMSARAQAL